MTGVPAASAGIRPASAFTVLLVAALAGAALHVAVAAARWHEERLAQAGVAAAAAAQVAARSIDADLAERTDDVIALGTVLAGDAPGHPGAASLRSLARGSAAYSWLGLADARGRVVLASGDLLMDADVSGRDWFRHGREGLWHGQLHEAVLLASLLPARADGEPWRFVDIAVPVRGTDGRLRGVLGAHLSWSWLQARLETVQPALPAGSDVLLVGRDGQPVGVRGPTGLASSPALRAAQAGGAGWSREDWPGAPAGVTGYAPNPGAGAYRGLGWVTLVRVPVEPWTPDTRLRLLREALAATGAAVALAAAAALALAARQRTARRG